jgi:aryl-alcohol dehydrogenase-like predicted oxidoreductase
MRERTLGRTGLRISEIGFGAWGIGGSWWGPTDPASRQAGDKEAMQALVRAQELGINFFDTAYVYGDGHSERLIADAFAQTGRRGFVATKVPPKNFTWPAASVPVAQTFPAAWITACTERSLKNLRTDCVELQQFHVWHDDWVDVSEWQEPIARLKQQGKIRFFGVSINDYQPENCLKLIKSGLVDSIQVIYNFFEQAPAERLFPACQEHRVGVIVRVPFDEGSLTGTLTPETTFHKDDFRADYFRGDRLREVCERVKGLGFLLRRDRPMLAQAALTFCLTHPAVSTVIPGMRKATHVEENARVSDGPPLTPDELERLAPLAWRRNFYQ